MKVVYENQVKAAGECVEEFKDAGMFIIFGENAPDEIKDYCYSVSVNPINGLPGTIYVEAKPMPEVKIGTKIQIVEK